jgi:YHS domain-containing protein
MMKIATKATAMAAILCTAVAWAPQIAASNGARARQSGMNMSTPEPSGKLTKVDDNSKICMVTNRAYDKPQIPVQVEGKTYYGCCEMCKGMLTKDATQRTAIDPVSKKPVDKSKAVIGVGANGGVYYFQNEKNLETYNARMAGGK